MQIRDKFLDIEKRIAFLEGLWLTSGTRSLKATAPTIKATIEGVWDQGEICGHLLTFPDGKAITMVEATATSLKVHGVQVEFLTAKLSPDGQSLLWSDGTRWSRVKASARKAASRSLNLPKDTIEGYWDKGTIVGSALMFDGGKFVELGAPHPQACNVFGVTGSDLITAELSNDGSTLTWSDKDVWTRKTLQQVEADFSNRKVVGKRGLTTTGIDGEWQSKNGDGASICGYVVSFTDGKCVIMQNRDGDKNFTLASSDPGVGFHTATLQSDGSLLWSPDGDVWRRPNE
jgi:hypothetical protein